MAKLTSKRFHEIDRIGFTTRHGYTGIIVQRSDGKFLRRFTGDVATGYNIIEGIPTGVTAVPPNAVLVAVVSFLGYTTNDTQTLRRL